MKDMSRDKDLLPVTTTIRLFDPEGKAIVGGVGGNPECLGRLNCERITLVVAHTDRQMDGFMVHGKKKHVIRLRNRIKEPGETLASYRIDIPVFSDPEGKTRYTRYPENHLRLLRVGGLGKLEIWEACVVSQDGLFFLAIEKTQEGVVYRDGDQAVYPEFAKWVQFTAHLAELCAGRTQFLPPLVSAPKCVEADPSRPTRPNIATVMWWHAAEGIGCVMTNQGKARVHWSQILGPEGRRMLLRRGESIRFSGSHSPSAESRTSFQMELAGVYMND